MSRPCKPYYLKMIAVQFNLLCIITASYSQKTMLEFPIGRDKLEWVAGINLQDSAFVFLNAISENKVAYSKSFWVLPKGESHSLDLPEMATKPVFNVAVNGNTTYYYYVEVLKKKSFLKALSVSNTGVRSFTNQTVPLAGKIYGSFVEDGNLFLLTSDTSPYILRLIQIRGMSIIKETRFNAGFNLMKYDKLEHTFSSGAPFTPSQALVPMKILKKDDIIFVSLDVTLPEYSTSPAPKENHTIISRLDLKTGRSSAQIIENKPDVFFNTIIYKDRLYRLTTSDGYWLEVFELANGKNIYSEKLGSSANLLSRPFIIADTTASGSLMLAMGFEAPRNSGVPMLTGFGLVGAMASMITKGVVSGLGEKMASYRFDYFEGSAESGFYPRNHLDALFTKVLNYELGSHLVYKGYINGNYFIYGIYRYKDAAEIQVVKFND